MKLTSKNIDEVIRQIKKKLDESDSNVCCQLFLNDGCPLLINPNKMVLSNRYNKKGRPKKTDYDCVRNKELLDQLKEAGYNIDGL